jgi:hypothetical protein
MDTTLVSMITRSWNAALALGANEMSLAPVRLRVTLGLLANVAPVVIVWPLPS